MHFNAATAVLTVDASLVARALPFRAYNDVRYYLNAICIEPEPSGGANVVATDGHTLICLHDPEGVADQRTLLPVAKGQRAQLRKGGKLHATADGRAFITNSKGACIWISPTGPVEGNYPDLKHLLGDLSEFAPGFCGAVNPAYLDRVREAQRTSSRWGQPVRFFHRPAAGANSIVAATFETEGFALIMPLRIEENQGLLQHAVPVSYRTPKANATDQEARAA